MPFNQEAITALYSAVVSAVKSGGEFAVVVQHEPKSAPQSLPALALWLSNVTPVPAASGLSATSARIQLSARVYVNALSKPEEQQDLKLLALASSVVGTYTSGFTLGGELSLGIDLLGRYGGALGITPGWLAHDDKFFRIAEITIPLILDDIWTQEA
jgi:hypothetical protein